MQVVIILLIGIALIIGMPFAIIWSLNTLFALTIPFTFWTWLATLILAGTVSCNGRNHSRGQ